MEAFNDYQFFLGRRVERLLIAGALLIGLALVAFYLSAASLHFSQDSLTRGLEDLALLIEGDAKPLHTFFDLERQRQKLTVKKKDALPVTESYYRKALEEKIAKASAGAGLKAQQLEPYVDASLAPADIVRVLRDKKTELTDRQGAIGSARLPALFSLQAGGVTYRIPSSFIATLLAVVLAPLIVGWMGALHLTRQRERALMARREYLHHGFPHLLNLSRLRLETWRITRFEWMTPERLRLADRVLVAATRTTLIALLVTPAIGTYAATLLNLGLGSNWLLAALALIVIAVMIAQAVALLMAEAADHEIEVALRITARGEQRRAGTQV
ncbi:MAG TPA: hypothetical protein VLN59_02235 [Burkholderiales bacterium]|nr:hypothetical protein [Burkholderiales bacterium]